MDSLAHYRTVIDLLIALISMVGTGIAFVCTIVTWREGQRWQRASKVDELILYFESNELIQLACVAIDWPARTIEFRGKDFSYESRDVLAAVGAFGRTRAEAMVATPTQARLRDAIDVLIAFFGRVDTALESRLIDAAPTRSYFGYWIERLVSLDRHPGVEAEKAAGALDGRTAIAVYIRTFSDPEAFGRLTRTLSLAQSLADVAGDQRFACGG